MDSRFQHSFPWNLQISNEEFMTWPISVFQQRITNPLSSNRTDGQDLPYYLVRFPATVPNAYKFRLTICPYFSNPSLRDISNDIARLYDVTDLFRQLFPNTETHPAIHTHEVALYLLKESDYAQYVQMFMHWLDVDESIDTLLIFQKLNNYRHLPQHISDVQC